MLGGQVRAGVEALEDALAGVLLGFDVAVVWVLGMEGGVQPREFGKFSVKLTLEVLNVWKLSAFSSSSPPPLSLTLRVVVRVVSLRLGSVVVELAVSAALQQYHTSSWCRKLAVSKVVKH
jgi:hypothetical protein